MCWTRSVNRWTKTRKADGTMWTTLQIPRPTFFTGKVACGHEVSLRFVLAILLKIEQRTTSYSSRHVDVKYGAVLRVCIIWG